MVYTDGSSKKVTTGGSEVRITGWGWTALGSNESFSRILAHVPQTNSVGELVGAVDVARSLMHCSRLLLVTDSRYGRVRAGLDRFKSGKQMGGDWRRDPKLPTGHYGKMCLKS